MFDSDRDGILTQEEFNTAVDHFLKAQSADERMQCANSSRCQLLLSGSMSATKLLTRLFCYWGEVANTCLQALVVCMMRNANRAGHACSCVSHVRCEWRGLRHGRRLDGHPGERRWQQHVREATANGVPPDADVPLAPLCQACQIWATFAAQRLCATFTKLLLSYAEVGASLQVVHSTMQEYDQDGDGKLDFEEFQNVMSQADLDANVLP